jgi:hypothetical protein
MSAGKRVVSGAALGLAVCLATGCGETAEPASVVTPPPVEVARTKALPPPPAGKLATILMVQAQFTKQDGRPVPGPAKLVLYKTDGAGWFQQIVEDPASNVFHKAIPWRDGILTIAAEKARLVFWKPEGDTYTPTVLWEKSWCGRFNRLRDLEIGDVDNDGQDEIVLASHDSGVVAVGDENADGTWTFTELDQKPHTFVHEIEIGDVDGDHKVEFYATPSERNRASGESQPGGVVRYDYVEGKYVRTSVVQWEVSHSKEILVADMDGNGTPELYTAREAHTTTDPATKAVTVVEPVGIVRLDRKADGAWVEVPVATLGPTERQCRFLVPGDVDGDGVREIVAAGYKTGLYVLEPKGDGTFASSVIDAASSGFEHATHAADLDHDGKLEIYVAADDQHALRQYVWNGTSFDKKDLAILPEQHITWNLQDGVL